MASPQNDDRIPRYEDYFASEDAAAVEAEVRAAQSAKTPDAKEPAWLPSDPDPFGMNWSWLFPGRKASLTNAQPVAAQDARLKRDRRQNWKVMGACAASLMAGAFLTTFMGRPGNGPGDAPLAFAWTSADVQAIELDDVVRGPEDPPAFKIASRRDGFITIASFIDGTRPEAMQVRAEQDGEPLRVTPESAAVYFPPATDVGSTLIVFITETPAESTIDRSVRRMGRPFTSPAEVIEVLVQSLEKSGFRWVEASSVKVEGIISK